LREEDSDLEKKDSPPSSNNTVGVVVEAVIVVMSGENKGRLKRVHDALAALLVHHVLVGDVGVSQHSVLQLIAFEFGKLCMNMQIDRCRER